MTFFEAIVLGIIQGLTEFFPVSSSGHLVIFQRLFGMTQPEVLFDVIVHVGTLAAIILFFFKDIANIVRATVFFLFDLTAGKTTFSDGFKDADVRMAFLIIIGTIPTVIIGLGLNAISATLFNSLIITGSALMVTSFLLLGTRWINRSQTGQSDFNVKTALAVGIMQGVAVIPGLSRSGFTIATGLFFGLDRETAARYSFLLSIPAIVGALMLSLFSEMPGAVLPVNIVAVALVTSFIVGYGALSLLVKIVKKGHLYYFAPYCALVGISALLAGM
jgi:undecaprenyl-diphosphatase